ncbi:MAG: ECF-type sigma factor [Isosphaeraceae bacterium]
MAVDLDRLSGTDPDADVLAVHDALDRLAAVEPSVARLVTLRYFGGRTLREAAGDLGVAPRTADAWWAYARPGRRPICPGVKKSAARRCGVPRVPGPEPVLPGTRAARVEDNPWHPGAGEDERGVQEKPASPARSRRRFRIG